MNKAQVYNQKAEKVSELELNKNIFSQELNQDLVHQAMLTQMSNERQVLAHTKDRSEVRGGGKKPWRQKGTGRARAGSNRSPIWIGGGVTFGPQKDRNFKKNLNKKMKRKAFAMVLSERFHDSKLVILDKLEMKEYKTKDFASFVESFAKNIFKTDKKSFLIIDYKVDNKAKYSVRNLPKVKLINSENINIVDLLKYQNIILSLEALKDIEKNYK